MITFLLRGIICFPLCVMAALLLSLPTSSLARTFGESVWAISTNIPPQYHPEELIFGVQFHEGDVYASIECVPYPESVDSSYPPYEKLIDMMADNSGYYKYLQKYVATKISKTLSNPKVREGNGAYVVDGTSGSIFYRYYVKYLNDPQNHYLLEKLWLPSDQVKSQATKQILSRFAPIFSNIQLVDRSGEIILDEILGHYKEKAWKLIGRTAKGLRSSKK